MKGDLSFKFIWKPFIIRIEKCEPVAVGMPYAKVSGVGYSSVFSSVVKVSSALNEFLHLVQRWSRTIVNEMKFEICVSLPEDGLYCASHFLEAVMDRDDDGNGWLEGGHNEPRSLLDTLEKTITARVTPAQCSVNKI